MKILLIVTGSISAYKAPSIANGLRNTGNEVKVILTKHAKKFIGKITFTGQGFEVYEDEFGHDLGGSFAGVTHIELKDWADWILIAPCTANTMAKMANGIADNLASSVLRARSKNIVISLAMNTDMYNHRTTDKCKYKIESDEHCIYFIKPVTKKLACGVDGIGALPNTRAIVEYMNNLKPKDELQFLAEL
jgi:phosphopantothenoylcysteine decarboxylase/phosphopantothenate--cysteine ligase